MVNNVNSMKATRFDFRSKNVFKWNIHTIYVVSLQHLNSNIFCTLIQISPEDSTIGEENKLNQSTRIVAESVSKFE